MDVLRAIGSRAVHLARAAVAAGLVFSSAFHAQGATAAAAPDRQTRLVTPHPALDRLAQLLGPTLEANRKELQGRTGRVAGFGAGDRYPQVWLRDSATLLPLSRYLYGREHLASWVEEHFAHQDDGGALLDWVAAGPASAFRQWAPQARDLPGAGAAMSGDKNTVEADQEASAVLALARVFAITGDRGWLRKDCAGRPLLERADRALRYLLRERFDRRLGLVTSGLSADWGDVSPAYPDQRAIYLDAATPVVAGLYTNAMFVTAARELAGVFAELGDEERASYWRSQARRVRQAINAVLWQPGRGFYRMHVPVGPRRGATDDSHIFAMGGHAVALLAGVADQSQAARILRVAEARRKRYAVSTIAGTLLPPFPPGFFKHPTVAEPYTYQNGGQWDWFAGRLVLAAFLTGHARAAYEELLSLGEKASACGGLFEWHTREGQGRGSSRYAGSAGALGAALVEGLFGVSLTSERLDLRVRLAERPGEVHLYQTATDTSVYYRYVFDAAARRLSLDYRSSHARPGRLAVLLPPGLSPAAVTIDGKKAHHAREVVGEDRYVSLETDWAPHRLEIMGRR